jgi:hypothetical protein
MMRYKFECFETFFNFRFKINSKGISLRELPAIPRETSPEFNSFPTIEDNKILSPSLIESYHSAVRDLLLAARY